MVLNNNSSAKKRINPHASEQGRIIERAKTKREELSTLIIIDYQNSQSEISRIIHWYNNERMHSSPYYPIPMNC